MKQTAYRICTRCIMDTSDPDISFSNSGECNHCKTFDEQVLPYWPQGNAAQKELENALNLIKENGVGKEYDCIIGLSGGGRQFISRFKSKGMGAKSFGRSC